MKRRLLPVAVAAAALTMAGALTPALSGASTSAPVSVTVTHTPTPPKGANDEYRCTWFDPHFTETQMVTKSVFAADPKTKASVARELHHAIAYIAAPNVVGQIKALDPTGKKGWSCFSSPLGATSMSGLSALPWLYGWSPGHGADSEPDGYGVSVPAGSLIVLQVHYNSLAGKSPVTATFSTWSEPQATSTRTPLYARQYVAAPDLPCVAPYDNVKKYPLCDHAASLNDLAKRFGASAKSFTQLIEGFCNRGQFPTSSSASNATSATCSYRVPDTVTIHSVWPHMHLLGKTFNLVVCHQDPTCAPANTQTLTVVGSYNFDLQVGYPINPPVVVTPGDYVKVTCTYDPQLRKLNPQTKNLAPRYVTWGDGSSDEMCLGTLIYSNGANT